MNKVSRLSELKISQPSATVTQLIVSTLSQFSLGHCRAPGKLTTFSYVRLKQKSSSSHTADRLKPRVSICRFESSDIAM